MKETDLILPSLSGPAVFADPTPRQVRDAQRKARAATAPMVIISGFACPRIQAINAMQTWLAGKT